MLDGELQNNVAAFAAWCTEHDIDLEPHGKPTMCPAIWDQQVAAVATAITVANYPQLRVAVAARLAHIYVANTILDPGALRWLSDILAGRAAPPITLWSDSVATVDILSAAFATRQKCVGDLRCPRPGC